MATADSIQICKEWVGKVAIVTGASAGIGLELARTLHQQGIKCIGCARNTAKIEQECSGVDAYKCDVSKDEEVRAMFESVCKKHGGVDILINNAGLSHYAPLTSGATEQWREMLEVNVLGLSICTREFLQQLKSRGVDSGYVINMCSMSGHRILTDPNFHFYTATKFAVTALTESLRQELREVRSGVKVSQVSPGLVATEFAGRASGDVEGAARHYEATPSLSAHDITQSVLYLLSTPLRVSVHDILIRPTHQAK